MQNLLHKEDFPTRKTGNKQYINKAKLIQWITAQDSK